MVLWVMSVGFESTYIFSGKRNEYVGSVQDFIFWFCIWCKSRELRGRMSPRFPCVTPMMESFSSVLLRTIISYRTKPHLGSCQTSMMELFCKNSKGSRDFDFSRICSTGFQMRLRLKKVQWMQGVGRLQVHGIRSHQLVHRELFETRSNYKRTWYVW